MNNEGEGPPGGRWGHAWSPGRTARSVLLKQISEGDWKGRGLEGAGSSSSWNAGCWRDWLSARVTAAPTRGVFVEERQDLTFSNSITQAPMGTNMYKGKKGSGYKANSGKQ